MGFKISMAHELNEPTNDNEELSFIALGALTANVIRWLTEQSEKKKTDDEDAKPEDQSEKDAEAQRDYIEHRLRELAAWEKRISSTRKI